MEDREGRWKGVIERSVLEQAYRIHIVFQGLYLMTGWLQMFIARSI